MELIPGLPGLVNKEVANFDSKPVHVLNYCDDIGGADRGIRAWRLFYMYQALLTKLGFQESKKKAFPPSTRMPYLGIQFDTVEIYIYI